MNAFTSWALARLQEPSTYAGVSAFVLGLTFLPQADLDVATKAIALAATLIPALIAMATGEKGGAK